MAKNKNSRDDDLGFRENEPNLSHSLDDENVDQEFEEEDEEESGASGLAGAIEKLKKIRWVKKNPNLAKGIAAGVLLLLMLLLFGWQIGWFSGSETKKPPVAAAQPSPSTAEPTPPLNRPIAPSSGQKTEESKKEEPKKQENLPIPDDVSKWKKADYYRARLENDARLLQAVVRLGEKARGSEPAAQGLTDLLKPLPAEPPPSAPGAVSPAPGKMPPSPGVRPPAAGAAPPVAGVKPPVVHPRNQAELSKLVEAIVAALGENGSDLARNTLEKIVSGELTTDDDKAAVAAALKALVDNSSPENDALLLRVLLTPEAVRPADRRGPMSAKEMGTKAFELVKPAASVELRTKLAEVLAARLARFAPGDPMREFLLAADPLNVGAQVVLYEKIATKEIKTKLEQQLISYSAFALARLLDFPEDAQAGGIRFNPVAGVVALGRPGVSEKAEVKVDPVPQIAGLLWSEKFRTLVESQLEELRSFERQPQLVLLAATIPQDSTRDALAKMLRKHWNEGPKALEMAGLPDRVITDPGLLVLLKMFPRKEAKTTAGGGRTAPGAAPRTAKPARSSAPAGGGKAAEAAKATQKKEQAEQDWMAVSSKLMLASCKRFHAAALAKEKAAAESGATGDAAAKLPPGFELGNDAKVVASYQALWPDEAPASISDQKPSSLEIHYVRAEETGKPKKTISFYGRQMQIRTTDARPVDGNKSTWLDGQRSDAKTDRRRSVDVLITRMDNKTGDAMKDDEETDLVVEILTIEIKDPARE